MTLNPKIKLRQKYRHAKASEEYIHVIFDYDKITKDIWLPTEYRRTGVDIKTEAELHKYLNWAYEQLKPENYDPWLKEQERFWSEEKPGASVTKSFFDKLVAKNDWCCVASDLPTNPNWARRTQDLKEFGYTLATDTKRYCPRCRKKKTHLLLIPLPRGDSAGNGYETWSPALRKRILKVLGSIDVYEDKPNLHSLPDHKFPEIRWGENTKNVNPDTMSNVQIQQKFQLLSNQRNQQKREVCRTCFQTGKRGVMFGIPFFYHGNASWDKAIPKSGKDAEKGCYGCPWYDIAEWRRQLIASLQKSAP